MQSAIIEKFHLNIIDIPGLTIKAGSDVQHILGIVKYLKDLPSTVIVACVVVVNFNSKTDQLVFKETVRYYANLFPSLFEQNAIIVMTGYATEAQRSDIERVKSYTINEVVNCASLSYTPKLFMINLSNCKFVTCDGAIEKSTEVRDAILKHLLSCKPLSITNEILVRKPQYLIEMNKEKIKDLAEEIAALHIEVSKCEEKEYSKASILPQLEADLTLTNERIEDLQKQIEEYDNSELVVADTWAIDSEWKLLKRCMGSFNLHSEWMIDSFEQREEGAAKWTFTERTDFSMAGTVVGQRNKALHASLTIKTMKRQKYASDIFNWRSQMEEVAQLQKVQRESLENCQNDIQGCSDKIKILLQFIERKQDQVTKLSLPNMAIEDAMDELNNFL